MRRKRRLGLLTAVWQRHDLVDFVLGYYRRVLDGDLPAKWEMIVVGSEGEASRALAERHGAHYVEAPNSPLSDKFNAGSLAARDLGMDGLVLVGSDDLLSARYLRFASSWCPAGPRAVGLSDCYILDFAGWGTWYWPGYKGKREGRPLGSGVVLSPELLRRLDWRPWMTGLDRNLDGSMHQRVEECGGVVVSRPMRRAGALLVLHGHEVGLTRVERIPDLEPTPELAIRAAIGADTVDGLRAFERGEEPEPEQEPQPEPPPRMVVSGEACDATAALAEAVRVQGKLPGERSLNARAHWHQATRHMIRAVMLDEMAALARGWPSGGYPPAAMSDAAHRMLRDLPTAEMPEDARATAEAGWLERYWFDVRRHGGPNA